MKFFYVCRTGYHTSVLAAALHLGKVGLNIANTGQIYRISGYDRYIRDDIGKPYLAGIDEQNAEVYTIGVSGENRLMIRAASELISLMGISPDDWRIVDTSGISSNWTLIGQFMRRIHLNNLSKAFFYMGARKELPRLITVVDRIREELRQ